MTQMEQTGEPEPPRHGTLAWLALQPHVDVLGVSLPTCHRVPASATLAPEPGRHCRVIQPTGQRCGAISTRRYGLCLVHSGGGGFQDPAAMSSRAHAVKARLRHERVLLGVGPSGRAEPRQLARLAALRRSAELASALVDAPLDDKSLGTVERQTAVLRALDATFPLLKAEFTVDVPADGNIGSLGWQDLQALAGRLELGEASPSTTLPHEPQDQS